jgi:hypothetical protein
MKRQDSKSEKVRWGKVGVLIDKDGKKSIKLDLIQVSSDSSDSLRRKGLGRLAGGIGEKGQRGLCKRAAV